jgi:hypothetical protein
MMASGGINASVVWAPCASRTAALILARLKMICTIFWLPRNRRSCHCTLRLPPKPSRRCVAQRACAIAAVIRIVNSMRFCHTMRMFNGRGRSHYATAGRSERYVTHRTSHITHHASHVSQERLRLECRRQLRRRIQRPHPPRLCRVRSLTRSLSPATAAHSTAFAPSSRTAAACGHCAQLFPHC